VDGRIQSDATVKHKTKNRIFFNESRVEEVKQSFGEIIQHRYDWLRNSPEEKIAALDWSRARARAYAKRAWNDSPKRRLVHRLRSRIGMALKRSGTPRARGWIKTEQLVGCSVSKLREHFEALFRDGMSWENYGLKGWVIDHKIPCSQFDLSRVMEQRRCFHYSNLQPLFDSENRKKGSRVVSAAKTLTIPVI